MILERAVGESGVRSAHSFRITIDDGVNSDHGTTTIDPIATAGCVHGLGPRW